MGPLDHRQKLAKNRVCCMEAPWDRYPLIFILLYFIVNYIFCYYTGSGNTPVKIPTYINKNFKCHGSKDTAW